MTDAQKKQQTLRYINENNDLTDATFMLFCAKNYDNTHCHDIEEFNNDLMIPMHLKKLFTRYYTNNDLKERLILNHLICFFNVFSPLGAVKILYYKIDVKYYSYLTTVLKYLDRCPDVVMVNGVLIETSKIELDEQLMKALQKC